MSDDTVLPVNDETSTLAAPMAAPPIPDETASEAQGEPAPSVLAPEEDDVPEHAPTPAVEAASNEQLVEPVTVAPTPEQDVREAQPRTVPPSGSGTGVIIEKEKPLTEEDKETIFKGRLQTILAGARVQKHTSYEKHLAQIVDFIRKRGTLVANQELEEGLHLPDSTVTDRLNELVKRGLIIRLGDQRHARYKLKEGGVSMWPE